MVCDGWGGADLIGSPRWHAKGLNDVMAMVDAHGMPHRFLTLTADEASASAHALCVLAIKGADVYIRLYCNRLCSGCRLRL